jgi:hypothetical protein
VVGHVARQVQRRGDRHVVLDHRLAGLGLLAVAAGVARHVDDHGAGLHVLDRLGGHEQRRAPARHLGGGDHDVEAPDRLGQSLLLALRRVLGKLLRVAALALGVGLEVELEEARAERLDLQADAEGEGGYAKELAEDAAKRPPEALAEAIGRFDVVITTAQVPGRRAPLLVTAQAVENMKPGSVIVDMAGESGGNCELTEPGETVVKHDVTIAAPLNLPGDMPDHASQLYSRNVSSLLELMIGEEGALKLDFDDAVIAGACITRDGEIVHEGAKQAVSAGAAS